MTVKKIYTAMQKVQQHMIANPIAKTQQNKFAKYNYRGIESVVQAFAEPLAANNIILTPIDIRVSTKFVNEKMTHTRITGTLRFVSLDDESFIERSYEGHSQSTQGKDLEAAKSFAYRDALLETFCVPFNQIEPETSDPETEESPVDETKETIESFKSDLAKAKNKDERMQIFKNYDKEADLVGNDEIRVQLNLIYTKQESA
tara:strand:+ start:24951 stop:25556 length:606 start_codon:yes stop_codon:yes gene_type:complete